MARSLKLARISLDRPRQNRLESYHPLRHRLKRRNLTRTISFSIGPGKKITFQTGHEMWSKPEQPNVTKSELKPGVFPSAEAEHHLEAGMCPPGSSPSALLNQRSPARARDFSVVHKRQAEPRREPLACNCPSKTRTPTRTPSLTP